MHNCNQMLHLEFTNPQFKVGECEEICGMLGKESRGSFLERVYSRLEPILPMGAQSSLRTDEVNTENTLRRKGTIPSCIKRAQFSSRGKVRFRDRVKKNREPWAGESSGSLR